MAVHNREIAAIFTEVADLLDIRGENQFRVRAYRNAARTVAESSRQMSEIVDSDEELEDLPGIGEDLAGKIRTILETGSLPQLEELHAQMPEQLTDLMDIAGLGPKRVAALHRELGIRTIDDLEAAAEDGMVARVEGFGEKTQKTVLEEIARRRDRDGPARIKLREAQELIDPLLDHLGAVSGVSRVAAAGSYRRKKETCGDLDLIASCSEPRPVMDAFVGFEDVEEVVSRGDTRSTVRLRGGVQVDLRVVGEESFGAALYYFTGSKEHNLAVRRRAVARGWKLNEYGLFDGERRIGGTSEEDIFEKLDLAFIVPELRENRGEVEAAEAGRLPSLVSLKDIRGDLQTHSTWTDGRYSIGHMVEEARSLGYEYYAVTDHSQRVTMAGGLDADDLRRQMDEIDRLNSEIDGIRILKSVECDILEDGSLDLPDKVLRELDLVVCSIHYDLKLSRDRMTRRITRAMENPNFDIFAHPTGRLIGERAGYDIDLEGVIAAAAEHGCILELNAHPDRLDLDDVAVKAAREAGVKIAISTDSHSIANLHNMRYGVNQARRGWLEAKDVVNTRPWEEVKSLLRRYTRE